MCFRSDFRVFFLLASSVFAGLLPLSAQTTSAPAAAPQVTAAAPMNIPAQEFWFSPRQKTGPNSGVVDWDEMLASDAQWPVSAAHIGAVAVNEGTMLHLSDAGLKQLAAFINGHHLKTFFETGIISRRGNEENGEGYARAPEIRATCEQMKKYGIHLDYLRMDEPIWFGHYDKNDHYALKLSLPDLMVRIKEDADEVFKIFPNAQLVDIDTIEPLMMQPDWESTYRDYKRQLEATLGKPITAIQVDVNWSSPNALHDIKAMADLAHSLGVKYGIIYNAGGGVDDKQWLAEAEKHFVTVESQLGVIPEQPIFQSWDKVPTHALPETSDTAHTHLIVRYLMPRTQIVAQRGPNNTIVGQLADETGKPIAGATIGMEAPSFDPAQPLQVLSVQGAVPDKARTAIMGIRVNSECLCDGSNDFFVGKLSYQETGTGAAPQTLDYPAEIKAHPPKIAKAEIESIGGQPTAHLVVNPDQALGFNSPAFTVTAGAPFTFQAPADMASGDGMYGKILIIWLDAQKRGFGTANIVVARQYQAAGSTTTGEDGRFTLPLPHANAAAAGPLKLGYSGSATMRAATAVVQ